MILLAALSLALAPAQTLEGRWQGTLEAGAVKLRLVIEISKSGDGLYTGTLDSIDQGARIPIDRIQLTENKVRLEVGAVKGSYEGTLNDERTRMKGTWTQGASLPLDLERATGEAKPAAPAKPRAPVNTGFGLPFETRVPMAPIAVRGGGKTLLVYELHLTNFSPSEFTLSRLEVLGDGKPMASYEGADLNGILMRPGSQAPDRRALGAGQRLVAFLFLSLGGAAPATIRHRITAGEQSFEDPVVEVATTAPAALGPPLRGTRWIAANGPGAASIHRRALLPMNGTAAIAQRFAIDWLRLGEGGQRFQGEVKDNKSYAAWGAEVLAVSAATVVSVKDGIPENEPGPKSRAVPMTRETLGGNYIVLDLGGGRFAFYAHLQPGSLRVKPGDKVKRGQVLGLVGNSGNSTEPHLHFHVSNGPDPLASEGLPFVFGDGEIPLQNAEVKFP